MIHAKKVALNISDPEEMSRLAFPGDGDGSPQRIRYAEGVRAERERALKALSEIADVSTVGDAIFRMAQILGVTITPLEEKS